MLSIIDETTCPPGGVFKYTQPESGQEFRFHSMPGLVDMVRKHRIANGYPTLDLNQQVIDGVCKNQPEICFDDNKDSEFSKLRLAASLATAMFNWAKGGFATVSKEGLDSRMETCRACPNWIEGRELINSKCAKCGCSGLKLFLSTEKCPIGKW